MNFGFLLQYLQTRPPQKAIPASGAKNSSSKKSASDRDENVTE